MIIEMPQFGGDHYDIAREHGKLAREIGQTLIEQVGMDEARKQLAFAQSDAEVDT